MNIRKKFKTASTILREQGVMAFIRKLREKVRKIGTTEIDEAKSVFVALDAYRKKGVMVDVGAHFGSSLKAFAESGWRVYAFEPDPSNRAKLLDLVGSLPNVTVDVRAISDRTTENVPFFVSKVSTGISGLSSFDPSHEANGTVSTITLEKVYAEEKISSVDFLKIDTEGYDLFVLKGNPWGAVKPRVVLCEFEDKKTVPLGYTYHDLASYLMSQGYSVIVSEWYPIERYGTAGMWRCYSRYPSDLEDSRAWGNLIAASDPVIFDLLCKECKVRRGTS